MPDDAERRWATLGLAGLLGLCCVSLTVLLGGAAAAGGGTAVATGVATARSLGVTVLVTVGTLGLVYLALDKCAR